MNPTLKKSLFLLAVPVLAMVAVLESGAVQPVSPVSQPVADGGPTFKVTSGPKLGTYSFPSGMQRGVMVSGTISPPLGPGETVGITGAVATCNPDGEILLESDCFAGGGQGGSFTGYIKIGPGCLGDNCSKVKLTYQTDATIMWTECVTVRNPDVSSYGELDPSVTSVALGFDTTVTLKIKGGNGQLNTTFDGTVTIIPNSVLGTQVLIDGSSGMTTVEVEDGVGTMVVRAVNGYSGDILTFDILAGGRLSPCRSCLDVQ